MFNFFKSNFPNRTSLVDFLNSTEGDKWNYKDVLSLNDNEVAKASYEQILNNPSDVVDGVIQVEVVLNKVFFGIFDNLIVKYRDDQSIQLMFYTKTDDSELVLSFFKQLKDALGGGYIFDHKYATFNEYDRIVKLAQGQAFSELDDVVHSWLKSDFSFMLSYSFEPNRQLLFTTGLRHKKNIDHSLRTKGTLLNILHHDLNTILVQEELTLETIEESGEIKYVDYTFELSPPELGIFDQVKVRIFDSTRIVNEDTPIHVTYFSKYEVDTAKIITLCDRIIEIYGPDSFGDTLLQPHELDMIDNSELWTGRTWQMDKAHELYDIDDETQGMLYEVRVAIENDEGFSLHIWAFQNMLLYHGLMGMGRD